MAYTNIWFTTDLPKDIIDILTKDLEKFSEDAVDSTILNTGIKYQSRKSKNSWISTNHWIGGFIWHYIKRANDENFLYDIRNIDGESIQYTEYYPGNFYTWHTDGGIEIEFKPQKPISSFERNVDDFIDRNIEYVRKLSFSLQLSDPDEYTGGDLQFMTNDRQTFFAPKQKGSIVIFDSRVPHRVRKVKTGLRRSLVGWVVGPRWK